MAPDLTDQQIELLGETEITAAIADELSGTDHGIQLIDEL